MNQLIEQVNQKFQNEFEGEPLLIKSPGRVNLIGEHTDYNEGFVLPAAVDKSIVLAIRLNDSENVRFFALDKEEQFESDISGALSKSSRGWPDYLLGIVDQLQKHGYPVRGFDCVFSGDVPIGAGMSSSAALEGGVLFGLDHLLDLEIPPVEMAQIAQKAENEFVGVQCGIMDQFVSLNGKSDHAVKLDCRTLDYEYYPFKQDDIRIVLCDTGVRRELATSEYNIRRQQCEQGVETLQKFDSDIKSLRDVEFNFLLRHKKDMDPTVFKRCKYIVEENRRVLQACADLEKNDMYSFGQRMYQSHLGLQLEYEVSCEELDTLVEIAWKKDGILGSRMMGGGFGGCTINLIKAGKVETLVEEIKDEYAEKMGKEIDIYVTNVSEGTHIIKQSEKA